MQHDDPDFIQCAFDAYEEGFSFEQIELECQCRLAHRETAHTPPPAQALLPSAAPRA